MRDRSHNSPVTATTVLLVEPVSGGGREMVGSRPVAIVADLEDALRSPQESRAAARRRCELGWVDTQPGRDLFADAGRWRPELA